MQRKLFIASLTFFFCTILFAQEPRLMLPIGNTYPVVSANFSPDSKYIVTASWDGTARVWNAISGQLITDLKGTFDMFGGASFSPDGKYIVSSGGNIAKVWNAISGQLVTDLKGHKGWIFSLSFSPDGKYIVTASLDSTAKVWNAHSGELVADLKGHTNQIWSASFSPDGKYVATASFDSTAKVWNTVGGQLIATLKEQTKRVWSARFSPDEKYIVTAAGKNASVWNAINGQLVRELKGHTNSVKCASFSPDGKFIVTASFDSTAGVWNTISGQFIAALKGHTGSVYSASFSPDSKYIVTASFDETAKVWNASSGRLIADLKGHTNFLKAASFSPNGKYIVTASEDHTAKVWNAINGQLVADLKGRTNYVSCASFSPDGKYIVTAFMDGTSKVWNSINGRLIVILKGHTQQVIRATFSPACPNDPIGGKYIVTASNDSTAKVWNAISGQLIADLKGHKEMVSGPSFSPDGKYIATTASLDSTAKVWNTVSGQLITDLKGHTSYVSGASFSPDSKFIVTASRDSTAKVWNAVSGQLIADLKGHTNYISSASFSPACPDDPNGGKYIVTASADSTAKVWNAVSGQLLIDLKGYKKVVNSVSFSPDGKYIVTAAEDNTPKVWNAISGQHIADLKGHRNNVTRASFSPNGKYIITISGDNTTKIWDAVSWQLIKTIEMDEGYLVDIDFKNNRISNIHSSEVSIHDIETGKKLYTFIAVDSSDYLIYDKDNRYDGTPDARKLLYFTCDREIIELDQVKDQLWVPNLAERIMNGETINAQKLSDLNICGLTPQVEDGSSKTDGYYFKILPRRGGLGETVLYINGIEAKRYKPAQLKKNGGSYELIVKRNELINFFIQGKENRVSVKAWTSDNAISSRGAVITANADSASAVPPNLYAVMVGISDYKGDELDLKYADKDATDISAVVSNAAKKLLNTDGKEHVFMYNLTTAKERYQLPEKLSVKKILEEIGKKATANDILLIFFAGHGVMNAEKKQFYFLTADASKSSAASAVAEVGISTAELTEWMKPQNIKAQKRILIFDACNSGQAINDFVKMGTDNQNYMAARNDDKAQQTKAVDKLNEKSGLFILSASASNQNAYEMGRYSQGLLTYSLLKAIKQQPDILEDGKYLNISRWFNAAEKTVGDLSKESGARQEPQIVSNTNFNIGIVDEEVMAKIVLPMEKPLFAASNFQNADENIAADNLGLNKLTDWQLNEISSRGSGASITYVGSANSLEAYQLSGRYSISGNTISIKVFIRQHNEVKERIDLAGTKEKLDEFAALIASKAAEWASKNK